MLMDILVSVEFKERLLALAAATRRTRERSNMSKTGANKKTR